MIGKFYLHYDKKGRRYLHRLVELSDTLIIDGSTVQYSGKAGDVQWAPAGAHLPENTSNNVLEVILVELKGK